MATRIQIWKRILFVVAISIVCAYLFFLRAQEGFNKDEIHFHFYNTHSHYGDCILNLKLFYNISPILEENNIIITYYYEPNYIKRISELEHYVDPRYVTLATIDQKPDTAIELWMGRDIDGISYMDFVNYHNKYYEKIIRIMNLESQGINTSCFQQEDYLLDIYNGLDDTYKDLDILILNSTGSSNQFSSSKEEMDLMCKTLSKKYKVATCEYVDETIPCTMRSGLSIQDIGAISTHTKYIIAILSGPSTGCFNVHTQKHLKKWIILESRNNITLSEIDYVIATSTVGIENYLDI